MEQQINAFGQQFHKSDRLPLHSRNSGVIHVAQKSLMAGCQADEIWVNF